MYPRSTRRKPTRRGIAATECALVLPVIFLLAFSTLEICSGLYLRQSATTIAFEAVRIGARGSATVQDVIDECNDLFQQRGISNATVTVSPDDFNKLKSLDPITVTVRAPCKGNTWFLWNLLPNSDVEASVTMVREFGS
jgi:Flp pilus assembly protein TadG